MLPWSTVPAKAAGKRIPVTMMAKTDKTIRTDFCVLIGAVALLVAAAGAAQYGHPLKGSWSGDWGPDDDNRTRLLLVLDWDGEAITGSINPGPNAVPIATASLDPSTWTLHFEAVGEAPGGNPVRYVVDGELQNIGSYNRVITGSWKQGAVTGDFSLMRN